MGAGSSRERLSRADMEFLLLHTHYDEKTIQGRVTIIWQILTSKTIFLRRKKKNLSRILIIFNLILSFLTS